MVAVFTKLNYKKPFTMIKFTYDKNNKVGNIQINSRMFNFLRKKKLSKVTVSSDSTTINLTLSEESIYGIEFFSLSNNLERELIENKLQPVKTDESYMIGEKSDLIDSFDIEGSTLTLRQKNLISKIKIYLIEDNKICGFEFSKDLIHDPRIIRKLY